MARIKAEDIMFWILVILVVGLAIWKLVGSPTDTAALISFALFIIGSEVLIWKSIFSIDKKTSIGFTNMKNDMSNIKSEVSYLKNKIEEINLNLNEKLNNIEILVKRRK